MMKDNNDEGQYRATDLKIVPSTETFSLLRKNTGNLMVSISILRTEDSILRRQDSILRTQDSILRMISNAGASAIETTGMLQRLRRENQRILEFLTKSWGKGAERRKDGGGSEME